MNEKILYARQGRNLKERLKHAHKLTLAASAPAKVFSKCGVC
jgi:hypothetical protein